ncbi:MAG: MIP/aquaporin family protein [Deferribacterota bacterium]|nr:MIP/aquaporin family protein [Deferribacterota bacterium]
MSLHIFLAEFLGTALLVLLGDGVVANVLLSKSKGENSGWIVITAGWGFAVMVGVYVSGWVSGAHINPAVTIGFAAIGKLDIALVPIYIIAQVLGAFFGAIFVYLAYLDHFKETKDSLAILSVFSTVPQIRNFIKNLITEIIGTMVLLIGVLGVTNENNLIGSLGALIIGLVVFSIGLSLGGPTGYAINPARDLGPRLAHYLLPIPNKGNSDFRYGIIVPIIGPIIGGIIGSYIYLFFIP